MIFVEADLCLVRFVDIVGHGDMEEVDPSNVFDLGEPVQHIAGFPNI